MEEDCGGLLVGGRSRTLVAFGTPAYAAGLDTWPAIAFSPSTRSRHTRGLGRPAARHTRGDPPAPRRTTRRPRRFDDTDPAGHSALRIVPAEATRALTQARDIP